MDRGRTLLLLAGLALLLAGSPSARAEGEGGDPPPAEEKAGPAGPEASWATDLASARSAAAERKVRILAVVTESFYASEPCERLAKAVEEPAAARAAEGFVRLRVEEKEDRAFSNSLGLEELGHPYTAILDASGEPLATLRGAFAAEAWAKEVLRLSKALDTVEARRAEAEAAPGDPRVLWNLSEALRDADRVREADDELARAENADPEGKSGLAPLFAFRRVEARMEDRMAVQDFEGAKAALEAYDREFPNSPRKRWVFTFRALCRAHLGEAEKALEDLKEVAAEEKDPALAALAAEKAAALEEVIAARK